MKKDLFSSFESDLNDFQFKHQSFLQFVRSRWLCSSSRKQNMVGLQHKQNSATMKPSWFFIISRVRRYWSCSDRNNEETDDFGDNSRRSRITASKTMGNGNYPSTAHGWWLSNSILSGLTIRIDCIIVLVSPQRERVLSSMSWLVQKSTFLVRFSLNMWTKWKVSHALIAWSCSVNCIVTTICLIIISSRNVLVVIHKIFMQ